jgi:endonuclease-3
MDLKTRVEKVIAALKADYSDAECSLDYNKDYELLFSVRLAAQCTDARVNIVTQTLYKVYPSLEAFAEADIEALENHVRSTGFFRVKARDLKACARILLDNYGGKIPDTMEELLKLPGIGRKTANLILGDVYGQPSYVCDTHCIRITNLLGFSKGSDPAKVEEQLRLIIPPEESGKFCHRMVLHGRAVCIARRPKCDICSARDYCDYANNTASAAK